MSDDKKMDEETREFYEKNKDMIDRIVGKGDDSERAYLEEMLRRKAFERRMRMEYEAERLRRKAFDESDQLYSDLMDGRERTEKAFDEARDHFRDYARREGEYFRDMFYEEADRLREERDRYRGYLMDRYEEDRAARRQYRDRVKRAVDDELNEIFEPFGNPGFQKHMVGAGLELWMALQAFIKAAPLPDGVKEAFTTTVDNSSQEFCRKNEHCGNRKEPADDDSRRIKISTKGKGSKE